MIKSLLYLAILTTFVVMSWIGFSVYHNGVTSTISPDQSIAITPIPAQFDQETMEELKSKKIVDANLNVSVINSSESVASEAAAGTGTPLSTSSAQLQL